MSSLIGRTGERFSYDVTLTVQNGQSAPFAISLTIFYLFIYVYINIYIFFFRVVIRGDKEDHAVLCTETQTYDIKQGEVSNTMLLLPDLEFSADVKKDSSPDVKYRQV